MVQNLFTTPRLVLGLLLLLVLSACGTTPDITASTLTVIVAGDGTGTVTSVPAGIDVTSGEAPGTLVVENGTEVTLTAVADDGSTFVGWSAPCADADADACVIEVNANTTVTATFADTTDSLVVTTDGTGAGNVTSVPAGIDLDAGNTTASFDDGTEVTLTATPATGSTFAGWTGACEGTDLTCTFTFSEGTSVTATFTLQSFTLTVATDGEGEGNVTSVPAGIDLDAGNTTADFDYGTVVTLTATAEDGWGFTSWSGACAGQGRICTFTIVEDAEITVTFSPPLALSVSVVRGGTADGSVTSDPPGIDTATSEFSADFEAGSVVTLTAVATDGAFSGWVGGGCDDVRMPVCEVTIGTAQEVIATFNDLQTQLVRVAAGGDDAVEFLGDSEVGQTWPVEPTPRWFEGWIWRERTTLHLGWSPQHNLTEAAFRFPAVAVPAGAIVTNATLQLTSAGPEAAEYPATGDLSLTIEGELSPNPSGFVTTPVTATTFAITTRPRTAASVPWDITGAWATNSLQQAPNAASILQEIVDQPGWTVGNALILFLKGGTLADEAYRRVRTFESGDPVERHPTLLVEYVVMPPLD